MKKYIMALDQGTTSSRCILFNKQGEIVSQAQKEYRQIYPKPGWVEHDPMDIWSTQLAVAVEAMAGISANVEDVDSIGITNQRETTIVWNRHSGMPVYNAIVWQCRRTADIIDSLPEDIRQHIRSCTGLVPDAYFSATKIKWILDHAEGAREQAEAGDLLFGTVDTWLMWNLSGRTIHATDYTNASRTMLFDIKRLEWDEKLLSYFDIPKSMMPEVYPSGHTYGFSDRTFFGSPIPITGVAGDQQSSMFGLGCYEKGDVKNTYGTGCFLLLNTGEEAVISENGLVTTILCGFDNKVHYALEGSVFIGGAVIQWLRDEMELIAKASLSEQAAYEAGSSDDVYLVPAFTGLGAPYWKQNARGVLVGMTRGFGKKHMIRAALESIAYQVSDVLEAMRRDSGVELKSLKADGGAAANSFLMQFQADLVDLVIRRPKMLENTALGVACIAGVTSGFWADLDELKSNMPACTDFIPALSAAEREKCLKGWKRAVKTAVFWADEE